MGLNHMRAAWSIPPGYTTESERLLLLALADEIRDGETEWIHVADDLLADMGWEQKRSQKEKLSRSLRDLNEAGLIDIRWKRRQLSSGDWTEVRSISLAFSCPNASYRPTRSALRQRRRAANLRKNSLAERPDDRAKERDSKGRFAPTSRSGSDRDEPLAGDATSRRASDLRHVGSENSRHVGTTPKPPEPRSQQEKGLREDGRDGLREEGSEVLNWEVVAIWWLHSALTSKRVDKSDHPLVRSVEERLDELGGAPAENPFEDSRPFRKDDLGEWLAEWRQPFEGLATDERLANETVFEAFVREADSPDPWWLVENRDLILGRVLDGARRSKIVSTGAAVADRSHRSDGPMVNRQKGQESAKRT